MAKTEYCVIGYGRFGQEFSNKLKALGKQVLIIEKDEELANQASRIHELVVRCDAQDINALMDSGVRNVKNVVVSTSTIENSIMICANLKQISVENILARAKNRIHERVLKTMGITNIVIPEVEVAGKLAIQMVYNMGADITAINKDLCWVKTVVTNPNILHLTVGELDLKHKFNAILVSITRKEQTIFPILHNTQFKIGDVVYLACSNNNIKKVIALLSQVK